MIISKSIFDYFEICPDVEFEKVDTKLIEKLFDAFWNLDWDESYLGTFSLARFFIQSDVLILYPTNKNSE